jgi:glutamyl-tRNA(Gln) amidotransferase subunit D
MIGNIFSEDMRFKEYNLMLNEIQKAIENNSIGIIISHGTDTMHYSSAALQYAIKNLNIPIILVGAQRSSDRASSDAFSNLDAAVDFIIENSKQKIQFRRVGICMHENISDENFLLLDGINAKKMHSTRRDAFKQINYLPYARIEKGRMTILREELATDNSKNKIKIVPYNTDLKICFFKSHPNMFAQELENLENYDAIIIEGTGIGNLPEHEDNEKKDGKILKALTNLCKKTKVISGTQTTYGEISLDIYSRGRDLQTAGLIGNRINLSTETLFCKTAHCLSQKERPFEEIFKENIEGFKLRSEDK